MGVEGTLAAAKPRTREREQNVCRRGVRRGNGRDRGGEGDCGWEEGGVRGQGRDDLRNFRAPHFREAGGRGDQLQGQGQGGRGGVHPRSRVLPLAAHWRGTPARQRRGREDGRGQDRVRRLSAVVTARLCVCVGQSTTVLSTKLL